MPSLKWRHLSAAWQLSVSVLLLPLALKKCCCNGKLQVCAAALQVATAALHERPLLWLRMADCCLAVLQPQAASPALSSEADGVAKATSELHHYPSRIVS